MALRAAAATGLLFVFLVGVNGLGDGFKSLGHGLLDSFFAATAIKFFDGGWFPLAVGAGMFIIMTTWWRGRVELSAIMAQLKEAKKGMAITLDWLPGTGTRMTVQGEPVGAPILGEDFYQSLLRIWLGPKPVQTDLKKALLGGG